VSFLWVVVWFVYRYLNHHPPQLHILNIWLLTLIVASVIDLLHYRRYVRRSGTWRR
jgi:hypothetical protein